MSWDTVSPGYRPLSWGYAGVPRMPPVSQDANSRFQTRGAGRLTHFLGTFLGLLFVSFAIDRKLYTGIALAGSH